MIRTTWRSRPGSRSGIVHLYVDNHSGEARLQARYSVRLPARGSRDTGPEVPVLGSLPATATPTRSPAGEVWVLGLVGHEIDLGHTGSRVVEAVRVGLVVLGATHPRERDVGDCAVAASSVGHAHHRPTAPDDRRVVLDFDRSGRAAQRAVGPVLGREDLKAHGLTALDVGFCEVRHAALRRLASVPG